MTEYGMDKQWNNLTSSYHNWRLNTNYIHKSMLALLFASLTGLGALVRIYTPFSPVPFTLQTFFVLFSGVMLGRYWGGASQALYIAIGVLGVPWFAGGSYGIDVLFGATGGYLLSFILVSLLVGEITERRSSFRRAHSLVLLMMGSSMLILLIGSLGIVVFTGVSISTALAWGFLPFVAVEIVKSIAAGGAARFLSNQAG